MLYRCTGYARVSRTGCSDSESSLGIARCGFFFAPASRCPRQVHWSSSSFFCPCGQPVGLFSTAFSLHKFQKYFLCNGPCSGPSLLFRFRNLSKSVSLDGSNFVQELEGVIYTCSARRKSGCWNIQVPSATNHF